MANRESEGDLLRRAREERGLSQVRLGEMVGRSGAAIAHYEKGRSRISSTVLEKLAKALSKPRAYFFGEAYTKTPPLDLSAALRSTIGEVLGVDYIPLVGRIPAGRPILVMEDVEDQLPFPRGQGPKPDFALRVQGDSMAGSDINNGDIVYVRRQNHPDFDGQACVVSANFEDATLKHVCRDTQGRTWLVPGNTKYPPVLADTRSVRIIGVYAGQFKPASGGPKFKFVPPDDQ